MPPMPTFSPERSTPSAWVGDSAKHPRPLFALVLFVDIDWNETNKQHKLKCQLLTTDGDLVVVPGPNGPQRVLFEASAEAGRPPGAIHGTSVRMPLTLNIPAGIPLEPGIYEWRVEVEGYARATASSRSW